MVQIDPAAATVVRELVVRDLRGRRREVASDGCPAEAAPDPMPTSMVVWTPGRIRQSLAAGETGA
jgi:hypothetical protein